MAYTKYYWSILMKYTNGDKQSINPLTAVSAYIMRIMEGKKKINSLFKNHEK